MSETPETTETPPVCDYEGSDYRQAFWEGQGRDYEDRVERIALKHLLKPASGQRLLELGAGFGRLSSFYTGYQQVVLVDYSQSQLDYARQKLGNEKYVYVAADIYKLPVADESCDAASMIRVLHHFQDVPTAFRQIRRTLSPGAVFVLEFASKRNLKAVLRYHLRKQSWSPYSEEPVEFVKLNFDFHPAYIEKELKAAGFETHEKRAVSYFRLGLFKRIIPLPVLVKLDSWFQRAGMLYSPSVFTRNSTPGQRPENLLEKPLFQCPECGHSPLLENDEHTVIQCEACSRSWAIENGVYNFKTTR